jgi:hypothetical protein
MTPKVVELIAAAESARRTREAAQAAADGFAQALLRVPFEQRPTSHRGVVLGGIYPRANLTQYHGSSQVQLLDDFTRGVVGPVTHVARRDGLWLLFNTTGTGPVTVHLVYESLRVANTPEVAALMAAADRDDPKAPPPAQAVNASARNAPPAFLQGNGETDDDEDA